jgi:hypothetical protein
MQTDTGGAEAATPASPHPLQDGNLVIDTKRVASDPVYSCQVQVDMLKAMNVDASDPRRVNAERSLEAARAAREANRPPSEKIGIIRRQIKQLTEQLKATTSKRSEQEVTYRALGEELNKSQADIQKIEKALTTAHDELKAQEALLPRPRGILKVGPQMSTIPEVTPSPAELFKTFNDNIRYHYSNIEDFGMDYAAFQYMAAAQGAIELHVQQCEAREREDVTDTGASAGNDMQDEEEVQPPAKRRHGWDPEPSGGTDTPILQPGSRETWTEEDFPILDGEIDAKTLSPTAGVIKSLKAEARKAQVANGKGKGKAKNKSGIKGKKVHVDQADEMLDALFAQARQGTPSTGAESGALGGEGDQTSAIGQRSEVQDAAVGAQRTEGVRTTSAPSSSSGVQGAALPAQPVQDTTGSGAAQAVTASATAAAGARATATADATPEAGAHTGAGASSAAAALSVAGASEPTAGPTGTGAESGAPKGNQQPIPSTTPGNSGEQGAGSGEPSGLTGTAGQPTNSGSLNQ